MNQTYILYNPHAGNGKAEIEAKVLCDKKTDSVLCDITKIESYKTFFDGLDNSDSVVVCGGDGTLNRFANDMRGVDIVNDIFYYARIFAIIFVFAVILEFISNIDALHGDN